MDQEHWPIFTLKNYTKVVFKEMHTSFVREHHLDKLQWQDFVNTLYFKLTVIRQQQIPWEAVNVKFFQAYLVWLSYLSS
jgi:hypothetical protein